MYFVQVDARNQDMTFNSIKFDEHIVFALASTKVVYNATESETSTSMFSLKY